MASPNSGPRLLSVTFSASPATTPNIRKRDFEIEKFVAPVKNPFSISGENRACSLRPLVCLSAERVSPYLGIAVPWYQCTRITMYQCTCIHSVLCSVKYLNKRNALHDTHVTHGATWRVRAGS